MEIAQSVLQTLYVHEYGGQESLRWPTPTKPFVTWVLR